MIRLGMIGTGSISRDALTPAISEVKGAELWSVLSRDKRRASKFAKDNNAASKRPGYDDIDEFLADPDLDAVIIATPDGVHASQTIKAAKAGKHVLVEKPMATSTEDADAMIEACAQAGVKLAVAYHMRWHAGHRKLAGMVHDGAFGDIYTARAQWTFKAADATNWRAHDDVGRWWGLAGVGTHSLDWIRWMMVPVCGEIVEVSSNITTGILGSQHDEIAAATLAFESGAVAQFVSSSVFLAPTRGELCASKGFAYCDATIGRGGGGRIDTQDGRLRFSETNPYAGEIADFVQAINEDRDPEVGGEEGRRNVEILSLLCP